MERTLLNLSFGEQGKSLLIGGSLPNLFEHYKLLVSAFSYLSFAERYRLSLVSKNFVVTFFCS